MYNQLVQSDPFDHAHLLPDLATTWDVAADGKTWTFKLRAGSGESSATWRATAPISATYRVLGRWTAAFDRASNATYVISADGKTIHSVAADQRRNGGERSPRSP